MQSIGATLDHFGRADIERGYRSPRGMGLQRGAGGADETQQMLRYAARAELRERRGNRRYSSF
jgi:hypothetical protein